MPHAQEFLSGFGLIAGKTFDGYILNNASATHETVKQYREYRYNITLTFKNSGNGTYKNLYNALKQVISKEHIIYGVRNPYKCIIDIPTFQDNGETLTWKLIGHSYRAN